MLQRYAKVLKKHGGSYLVQSPNGPRKDYVFSEHKANIIAALNDYGKAVERHRVLAPACISTPAQSWKHAKRPTK